MVFERSDFENYLKEPLPAGPAQQAPPPMPAGGGVEPMPLPAPLPPMAQEYYPPPSPLPAPATPQPPGLLLSPTQATILTVVAILLLALAFGAGLLVGRYLL